MIRRKKRKHCVRVGHPLRTWTAANQEWALDFANDALACGRAYPGAERSRWIHAEVFSVGSGHQLCQSESDARAGADRGRARTAAGDPLRTDGFDQPSLLAWCAERKIELVHIQLGKSTQNARIESFHGRLREECLAHRSPDRRGLAESVRPG